MRAKTNREALREVLTRPPGPDLCEWDPLRQAPARLKDPFHGYASAEMVTVREGEPCRTCERCADLTHCSLLVSADRGVESPELLRGAA